MIHTVNRPARDGVGRPPAEESAGVASFKTAAAAPSGRETVLVVEDDDRVRTIVRRALARYGYHVLEARDGSEALMAADAHPIIHVVLCDVVMPGLSGPDTVGRLQARSSDIRALFMSGYTSHPLLAHVAGHEAVQKPFTPEGLARRIRDVLDAKPAGDAGVQDGEAV